MVNFPGGKRSWRKAKYFPSSSIEYKNAGSLAHFSYIYCHSIIKKHMITFNPERSEVHTEVTERISVFWNVISCSLLEIYHIFHRFLDFQ